MRWVVRGRCCALRLMALAPRPFLCIARGTALGQHWDALDGAGQEIEQGLWQCWARSMQGLQPEGRYYHVCLTVSMLSRAGSHSSSARS